MNKLEQEQIEQLNEPLPDWAVKPHPTKTYLSTINPMAIIDRLNEVFGLGAWKYQTEPVNFVESNNEKTNSFAVVKGTLIIEDLGIHLEQFGGNDNKDVGDAYKGASTDALTKIASYLGIGASIYKGQGNTAQGLTDVAFGKLRNAYRKNGTMTEAEREQWEKCSKEQRVRIGDVTKELRKDKEE